MLQNDIRTKSTANLILQVDYLHLSAIQKCSVTTFSYVIHNGEIENGLNQKSIKHRGRMHEFTFLQHNMLIIPVKCIDAIMST